MKKIIILTMIIGSFLLSDAVKVQEIAEKNTYRVVVPLPDGIHIASGTSFFINEEGYLITNDHVVEENVNKFMVKNKFEEYLDVVLIKRYPKRDIAILKVNNYTKKTFLKLQNPSNIKKGLDIYALGFPGGADLLEGISFNASLSGGLISKIDVTSAGNYPENYKFIQIDAVINHGNSGGPLLSRKATVLGINTLGRNNTQGIFWSIHVEELIKTLDENNIKYHLSSDDIGDIDTSDMQENISDVQSNSKLIFIAIAIIVTVLVLIMYLVKKNHSSSVKSGELSKLIRDKMRKYKEREDVLPTPPSPQPTPVRKKTISILESLVPENPSLPIISLESKKSITLGRSNECDISINDTEISKKHLRITLIGALVEIEDLSSANGTYIDGKKLDAHKKIILKKDERLLIANENNVYSIKDSKRKIATSSIKLVAEDLSLPVIHIKGKLILGRSQKSDITIDNDEVSRTHLEIQERNGKVEIKDLGSGNGTYINGKKLIEGDMYYLLAGDQLVIGSEDVIYKIG